jgi:DNA-binding NtrC family response regulator
MMTVGRAAPVLPNSPNRFRANNPSCVPEKAPEPSSAKPRVLVINDERNICELLLLYLEPLGLEVATVHRADEARTLITRGQFDLVVLDWELEGGQGLALLRLSKAEHPAIPVIIFTGGDLSDDYIENASAREADAVVRRKSSLGALVETIMRHLEPRDDRSHDRAWVQRIWITH